MLSILVFASFFYANGGSDTPIVGILTQETYIVSNIFPREHHDSYIAASYVKYLESAGARVVPIWIGQSNQYYQRVVNYTNGILFPGGGTYFNESGGYGDAARRIFQYALKANDRGIYYPILGLCLGMQVLPFSALNGTDIRVNCNLRNVAVPLIFEEGFKRSKLYSKAPQDIILSLESQNLTYNYHRYCLTKKVLKDNGVLPDWKILSTNLDKHNNEFISSMESVKYPIFGVQFHPEKNAFEFTKSGIPHTSEAVSVSQYFSNFFLNECRRNNNTFPRDSIVDKLLIYNYNPRYTGIVKKSSYEQIYVFNKTDFAKAQFL